MSTVVVSLKYSPDQPRDPAGTSTGGRFTSTQGGGEAHSSKPKPGAASSDAAQTVEHLRAPAKASKVAELKRRLKAVGIPVESPDDLPKALISNLQVIQESSPMLTEAHAAALEGVVSAAEELDQRFPAFSRLLRETGTKFALARYAPAEAAMTMCNGQGQSHMLFNLEHSPAEMLLSEEPAWSIGSVRAAQMLSSGSSLNEAVRETYRGAFFHEVGHLADHATGDGLSQIFGNSVIDALMTSGHAEVSGRSASEWVRKHVSGYAATSVKEGAAEAFSLVLSGAPVPAWLRDFAQSVIAVGQGKAATANETKGTWNEADHPRDPSGTSTGGQFTSGAAGDATAAESTAPGSLRDTTKLHYDKEKKKWVRADGEPVSEETAARLKAAGVKPAYTEVELNPDPNAALQARGKDAKGRTQYMYSKEHSEAAAAEKFSRLRDFNAELPGIRSRIASEMKNGATPSERDAAAVLHLIERSGIRVGSDEETGATVRAYGASTLLGQHVTLGEDGKTISLEFVGKSGKLNKVSFQSPDLHTYIAAKNLGPNDRVFAVNDARVRSAMKVVAGPDFSPKDFRTWRGTSIALSEVKKLPIPSSTKEYQHLRQSVAKVVAQHLNNTPTVALGAYIDPAVFKIWEKHV